MDVHFMLASVQGLRLPTSKKASMPTSIQVLPLPCTGRHPDRASACLSGLTFHHSRPDSPTSASEASASGRYAIFYLGLVLSPWLEGLIFAVSCCFSLALNSDIPFSESASSTTQLDTAFPHPTHHYSLH